MRLRGWHSNQRTNRITMLVRTLAVCSGHLLRLQWKIGVRRGTRLPAKRRCRRGLLARHRCRELSCLLYYCGAHGYEVLAIPAVERV